MGIYSEKEFDYFLGNRNMRMQTLKFVTITMLMFMVFFLIFSFVGRLQPHYAERLQLENEKMRLEIQGMKAIPNLEEKIAIIERKTNELTVQSIENRLSAIETAISKGNIDVKGIKNLQELNAEINKLKTYLFDSTDEIIEFKTLQTNYKELKNNQSKFAEKEDVRRDIDFQRTLLVICLSIFGVLVTIFGTSWVVSWKKNKKNEKDVEEKEK